MIYPVMTHLSQHQGLLLAVRIRRKLLCRLKPVLSEEDWKTAASISDGRFWLFFKDRDPLNIDRFVILAKTHDLLLKQERLMLRMADCLKGDNENGKGK